MLKRIAIAGGSIIPLLVLIGLLVRYVGPAAAQGLPQRTVEPPIVTKMAPLVFFKATTVGGSTVQTGRFAKPRSQPPDPITPFEASDDWVQQTTVYLLNRTNQGITWVLISFTFPNTNVGLQATRLYLGLVPETAASDPKENWWSPSGAPPSAVPIVNPPDRLPLLVRPGELLEIRLGDHWDQIGRELSPQLSLGTVKRMSVVVQACYFAPDVMWNGNHFRVRDRASNTWQDADRDYFPGDTESRLPGQPGWPEQ
jgi:hypothetical protein